MSRARILAFLLAAATLHAAPFNTPDDWTLGVEFPSQPKISPKQPAGEVLQTTAICDSGSSAFIAIRTEYSSDIPTANIAAMYDRGRDAMLKAMSADLVSEEKIVIGGHEGRRYVLEAKNGTRRAESRVVLIGNELYQFMFATKAALDARVAVTFFSTIELHEKKS